MPTGHDRAVAQHRHGMDRDALHDADAAASAAAQLQAASFAEPVNTVEEQPLGLKLTTRHGHSLAERPSAQVQITNSGCCGMLRLTQPLTLLHFSPRQSAI